MNKQKRKELEEAIALLERAKEIVENICEAEQDAFDNLSEGLQASEMGQKMETAIDSLGNAVSGIEDVISEIETATE